MRVVTFLLSLAISLGCIVLNLLGFNGTLSMTEYMLVSIACEVILAFLLGYFMFRTYANRKSNKKNASFLEEAHAKINDLETTLAAHKESAKEAPATSAAPAAPADATAEIKPEDAPKSNLDATTLYRTPLAPPSTETERS